jgi:Family of unknown function (DUF5675)
MMLEVRRRIKGDTYTISDLLINDVIFCQMLEDQDRGLMFQMPLEEIKKIKVWGKTAIPTGIYEMVFNYSAKFKKELPLLLNVPGFTGIRWHPGNTEVDTEGCQLPGKEGKKMVTNSVATFNKLMPILNKASKQEKIYVFVTTNYDS